MARLDNLRTFYSRTKSRRERDDEKYEDARRRLRVVEQRQQPKRRESLLRPITHPFTGEAGPWSPEVSRFGATRMEMLLGGMDPSTEAKDLSEHWSDLYVAKIGERLRGGYGADEAQESAASYLESYIEGLSFDEAEELQDRFGSDRNWFQRVLGDVAGVKGWVDDQRFRMASKLQDWGVLQTLDPSAEGKRRVRREEYGFLPELTQAIEAVGWEESKAAQRPLIRAAVEHAVEPAFLYPERIFEEVTGVPAEGKVAWLTEEVAAETMHPVAIAAVLPFAAQMTAGKTGVPLAAQVFSNLTGTGLEPGAARLLMKGATAGFRVPARPATRLLARGTIRGLKEEEASRILAGFEGAVDPGVAQKSFPERLVMLIEGKGENPYEVGLRLGKGARGGMDLTAALADVPANNVRRVLKDITQGNPTADDLLPARGLVEEELGRTGRTAEAVLDAGGWKTFGREVDDETLAAVAGRTPRTAEDPLGRLTQADEVVDEAERVATRTELEQVGGPGAERTVPATDPVMPNPNTISRDVRYLMSAWRDASRSGDSMGALVGDVANAILKDLRLTREGAMSPEIVAPKVKGQSMHWNDVFSFPEEYNWLKPEFRAAVDDYHELTRSIVKWGVDADIFPKAFLEVGKKGRYVPRHVISVGDEVLTVGLRRGRVGLKQTHQLKRTRPQAGQAGKVPIKYLDDPAMSLSEFAREVKYRIASEQLAGEVDKFAKTIKPTEKTARALGKATTRLSKAREDVKRLKNLRQDLRKMEDNAAVQGKKKLAAGYRDQQTTTVVEESAAKAELARATRQHDTWAGKAGWERETFMSRHPDMGYLAEPFAAGKVYPKALTKEYWAGMRLPGGWKRPIVSAMEISRAVNTIFKPIWAAGDLSFTALQTAPSLGVNPAAWTEMMALAVGSLANPQLYYQYMKRNMPIVQDMIAHGVPLYGSEFGVEAARGMKGFDVFLKTIGRPLQWGSDSWNRSLNLMATMLWEQGTKMIDEIGGPSFGKIVARAFGPGVVKGGESAKMQLASVISHGTGRLTIPELAKRGPVANLVMQALPFAGQYWEAYGRLVVDAMRLGMRGNLGRRMIAGWAAMGIGVYSGIATLMGQKPMLDPTKDGAKLLTLRIGDRRIGVGGPLQQMLLLAGRVADDPKNANTILERFLRGKASPLLSLVGDLIIYREDYLGYQLNDFSSIVSYMMSRTVPFAFQDVMEEIGQDLTSGEGLERTFLDPDKYTPSAIIPEFLGGRSFPISTRQMYYEAGTEEWRAANPGYLGTDEEIQELIDSGMLSDPDVFPQTHAAKLAMDEDQRRRDSAWQKIADASDKHTEDVRDPRLRGLAEGIQYNRPGGGFIYRSQASTVKSEHRGYVEGLPATFGVNPDDLPEKESRNAKILLQLAELNLEDFMTPDGLKFDYDAYEQQRNKLLARLSPEVRKAYAAGKYKGYKDPTVLATEKRLDDAQEALDHWYDIPKYRGLTNEQSTIVDQMIDWARQVRDMYALQGHSISTDYCLEWLTSAQPEYAHLASFSRWANKSNLRKFVMNDGKEKWTLTHPDLAVFYSFTYDDMSEEGQLDWQQRYALRR